MGLYDYRHRAYSPTLGRSLQVDPMESVGNTYSYCDNHNNCLDPLGLQTTVRIWTSDKLITLVNPTMKQFRQTVNSLSDRSVSRLQFVGHGSRHFMTIEDQRHADDHGLRWFAELPTVVLSDTGEDFIPLIRPKLCPEATIELRGCNTARENLWFDDQHITRKLSELLPDCTVVGFGGFGVGNQFYRRMIGRELKAIGYPVVYRGGRRQ